MNLDLDITERPDIIEKLTHIDEQIFANKVIDVVKMSAGELLQNTIVFYVYKGLNQNVVILLVDKKRSDK